MVGRFRIVSIWWLIIAAGAAAPLAAQDPAPLSPAWTQVIERSAIPNVDLPDALSMPWARTHHGGSVVAFSSAGSGELNIFRFDAPVAAAQLKSVTPPAR